MQKINHNLQKPSDAKIEIIQPNWPLTDNIIAGTSCRFGGLSNNAGYSSLNLAAHVDDNIENVSKNRQRFLKHINWSQTVFWLPQTHSDNIANLDHCHLGDSYDAAFTKQAGKLCVVLTADCLPVLIADRSGKKVAAVHAGWRGLANGIITKTIAAMQLDAADIYVWLGPYISAENYIVDDDLRLKFCKINDSYDNAFSKAIEQNKYHADLAQLASIQLSALGVDSEQIYGARWCTASDKRFYSYRQHGARSGRMATFIGINGLR